MIGRNSHQITCEKSRYCPLKRGVSPSSHCRRVDQAVKVLVELGKTVEDASITLVLRRSHKDRDTRVGTPDASRRLDVFRDKAGEASKNYDVEPVNVDPVADDVCRDEPAHAVGGIAVGGGCSDALH